MRVTAHKRREYDIHITQPTNGLSYDALSKGVKKVYIFCLSTQVYYLLEHAFRGHRSVSSFFSSDSWGQFLLPLLCICANLCICTNLIMVEIMPARGRLMRAFQIGLTLVLTTYWFGLLYSIVGRN